MRKPEAASAAIKAALAGRPDDAPARLVCLALLLAVVTLTFRIAAIW
jgi:hypothetical protein